MVVRYFAEHPNATERQAAADLGLTKSTVHNDIKRAREATIKRAAEVYVAAMIQRNEAIIEAFMPPVLRRASTPHATLVLAADKRTAELLGLDAPTRVDIEHRIRQMAEAVGIDPEAAIAEAEAIIREIGARAT